MAEQPDFSEKSQKILTMMMAECAKSFEKLPILQEAEILRNILYSGVWVRYAARLSENSGKNAQQLQ